MSGEQPDDEPVETDDEQVDDDVEEGHEPAPLRGGIPGGKRWVMGGNHPARPGRDTIGNSGP